VENQCSPAAGEVIVIAPTTLRTLSLRGSLPYTPIINDVNKIVKIAFMAL
jgi:hypothetical protein